MKNACHEILAKISPASPATESDPFHHFHPLHRTITRPDPVLDTRGNHAVPEEQVPITQKVQSCSTLHSDHLRQIALVHNTPATPSELPRSTNNKVQIHVLPQSHSARVIAHHLPIIRLMALLRQPEQLQDEIEPRDGIHDADIDDARLGDDVQMTVSADHEGAGAVVGDGGVPGDGFVVVVVLDADEPVAHLGVEPVAQFLAVG
jgi:hypothetical protein